jgi:acetyl esterase/lipase
MRAALFAILSLCAPLAFAKMDEPRFAVLTIDASGQSPSCAVIDVNQDGRLDVVSGGFWYESPPKLGEGTWKKHFAREVENIRGRLDEYSLLPSDLNHDGYEDLIVCNYRSKSIQFVMHPGAAIKSNPEAPWTTHLFAEPGASETGRLVDLDGDGLLDLLPNGTDYAAWWKRNPKGAAEPFTRIDLPREIAGHGIGAGPIDGRMTLVTPQGYWKNASRRGEEMIWKQETSLTPLHRDSSVPIVMYDVDGDGDQDLVWARAHHTGLYWTDALLNSHAIDTEITQAHSLLLGDLDGDGVKDLIAGSRVMAHDGKDIGEYDPLMIAAYQFQHATKSWRRTILTKGFSESGGVGFGLDPKLIDIDGDGDLDIVAADRKGLYLLVNEAQVDFPEVTITTGPLPLMLQPQIQLQYLNDQNQIASIKSPDQWGRRRLEILSAMEEVMGQLPTPERRVPLDVQLVATVDTEKYTRKKITFLSEPGDRLTSYLLIPKELKARAPAMLCLHQTTPGGKDSPAGLSDRPSLHYAHELAERGYVCIVPDYPSFGDYKYDFKAHREYTSGTMKAIWNNHRAIDLLEATPFVDPDRIGVIGHSLGGHNAIFTAAFDRRIKAVVTSCGFTAFHHYYKGDLKGWTSDRYMPLIASKYENNPDKMPFDFHGVLSAIAPRAIFICAPLRDENFAVEGVREVQSETSKVFELLKAGDRLRFEYPDEAHDFPNETRRSAYDWLDRMLR